MFFPFIALFLLANLDPLPLQHKIRTGPEISATPRTKEILSCRVRGYYPFSGKPRGLSGFLFGDVHSAIEITTSVGGQKLKLDFMTKDGQAADVWTNEFLQLAILLGASIPGEVRLLGTGKRATSRKDGEQLSPQLQQIMQFVEAYDMDMNIYLNNCRTFTRKMEREVERLNNLADSSPLR
jgi:hypothetical protein